MSIFHSCVSHSQVFPGFFGGKWHKSVRAQEREKKQSKERKKVYTTSICYSNEIKWFSIKWNNPIDSNLNFLLQTVWKCHWDCEGDCGGTNEFHTFILNISIHSSVFSSSFHSRWIYDIYCKRPIRIKSMLASICKTIIYQWNGILWKCRPYAMKNIIVVVKNHIQI